MVTHNCKQNLSRILEAVSYARWAAQFQCLTFLFRYISILSITHWHVDDVLLSRLLKTLLLNVIASNLLTHCCTKPPAFSITVIVGLDSVVGQAHSLVDAAKYNCRAGDVIMQACHLNKLPDLQRINELLQLQCADSLTSRFPSERFS